MTYCYCDTLRDKQTNTNRNMGSVKWAFCLTPQ